MVTQFDARRTHAGGFVVANGEAEAGDSDLFWIDADSAPQLRQLAACRSLTEDDLAHLGNPASRPDPTAARIQGQGAYKFWGFGATCSRVDDVAVVAHIDLQPVTLVATDNLIVTVRHRADRYLIGDCEVDTPEDGDPLRLDLLGPAACKAWLRWHGDQAGDRDLLFFSILEGLLTRVFSARSALGKQKVEFDEEYFQNLVRFRRRAAEAALSPGAVEHVARDANYLVDHTRRQLASIQRCVVPLREWFDYFKPAGQADPEMLWLPETKRLAESKHIIDRTYQVRNDLRSVRREIHESMSLLATADTGGQLLAVRALLDRTESARNAAIVAATVTVLLASIGLATYIAAIPSRSTAFGHATAAAVAGVVAIAATLVGVIVALVSRRPPPTHTRVWLVAAGCTVVGTVAAFALGTVGTVKPIVAAPSGFGLACLAALVVAYVGEFGQRRAAPRILVVVEGLLASESTWKGTAADLAARVAELEPPARRLAAGSPRASWPDPEVFADWRKRPAALVEELTQHRAALEDDGFSFSGPQGPRALVEISRQVAPVAERDERGDLAEQGA